MPPALLVSSLVLAPVSAGFGFPYRGIYISAYRAAQRSYIDGVAAQARRGRINTVVVDVKTDFGFLAFPCHHPLAEAAGSSTHLLDLPRLLPRLKQAGLRTIARLVVFKDPYLAKVGGFGVTDAHSGGLWYDEAGNAWVSPYDERVWEYNIAVARAALDAGFDEIQFDYVRFPTDGNVWSCVFPRNNGDKYGAVAGFLARARKELRCKVAADVYGYATWRVLVLEGQDLSKMGRGIDYVCPMLYPSHFASRLFKEFNELWRGYWIYYESIKDAQEKLAGTGCEVVPYVQAFDYKAPGFGPDYIYSQIRAALDAGAPGFFLWHAAGDYATAYRALEWVERTNRPPAGIHHRD